MTDLQITTTRGTDIVLDEATMQGFQSSVRGPLLRPGDAGYDAARKVWNADVDKQPALIVRCAGVADVITRSTSPAPTICWWRCAAVAITSRATRV